MGKCIAMAMTMHLPMDLPLNLSVDANDVLLHLAMTESMGMNIAIAKGNDNRQ